MSKYRLELKCGGKLLGRWEIGEEPLDLSLSQDDEECLYFRLGTNDRVQKDSENSKRDRQNVLNLIFHRVQYSLTLMVLIWKLLLHLISIGSIQII